VTDKDIADLGPAFARWLAHFRGCFLHDGTAGHFGTYCRGLLSDLPRKTVEPIALAAGTTVRTLQVFLAGASWDHRRVLGVLQGRVREAMALLPPDPLGVVGVIDETSCVKKGDKTPGVRRQYLGCVGKTENGVVTVHLAACHGRFQAMLDADLYLPKSWDDDRDRCAAAGIPDDIRYRPKWEIALGQLTGLILRGWRFDWLTFDEGYGSKVPFLTCLDSIGQRFVAEVPVNFSVAVGGLPFRADEVLTAQDARRGRRFRFGRKTRENRWWRAAEVAVTASGHAYRLVVAIDQATAEVKYFLTNAAAGVPLRQVLAAGFRRATVEHGFRLCKQEAGLTHYEGRQYAGLMRHLALSLVVMGFVSIRTDRLRGEKSGGDDGAGVPGAEREVLGGPGADAGHGAGRARGRGDPLPPAPQRASDAVTQEASA